MRAGIADRPGDQIALAQPELADLAGGDVHVPLTGQIAGGAQEAVSLGEHVEEPFPHLELTLLVAELAAPAARAVAIALAPVAVATGVAAIVVIVVVGVVPSVGVVVAAARGARCPVVVVAAGPVAAAIGGVVVARARGGGGQVDIGGGVGGRVVGPLQIHDLGDETRLLESIGVDADGTGDLAQLTDRLLLQLSSRGHLNPRWCTPALNGWHEPAQHRPRTGNAGMGVDPAR